MKGALAALLLAACSGGGGATPDGGLRFNRLEFGAGNALMRPGACANVGLFFQSAPQIPLTDMELALTGPGHLTDLVDDGSGVVRFQICGTLAKGNGTLTATYRADPKYTVAMTYGIGLPDVDPTQVLEPQHVFGRIGVATTLQWSGDGTKLYVSTENHMLRELDAATLTPLRAWVGLGYHTKLASATRAYSDGYAAAEVFDLDQAKSLTWLPGPVGDWTSTGLDDQDANAYTRGAAGVGDLVAVSDRDPDTCSIGFVDLATGERHRYGSIPGGYTMQGPTTTFEHELAVDISPNARYIATTGASSCLVEVPGGTPIGNAVVYDRTTDQAWTCGQVFSPKDLITTQSQPFSSDGGVFAWSQLDRIHVRRLPGCTEDGIGVEPFPVHLNVAVSPDGTRLAVINDQTDLQSRLHPQVFLVDITPGSSARHAMDAKGATLTTTDGPMLVALPVGEPNEDPWRFRSHLLAFSPDGKTLAAATVDGRLYLIDTTTGDYRVDAQPPYQGSATPRVSPDGRWLARDRVVDLSDGHVVYEPTSSETIVDVQDDGFYVSTSPNTYKVDYATLARTNASGYVAPAIDRSSPIDHARCAMNGSQLCIGTTSCAALPPNAGPPASEGVMIDETECIFTDGTSLYHFSGPLGTIDRYGPDPAARGTYSEIFRGNGARAVVTAGGQIATWRLP